MAKQKIPTPVVETVIDEAAQALIETTVEHGDHPKPVAMFHWYTLDRMGMRRTIVKRG